MKLYKLLKSVLDQDTAPVVVCDMDDIIVYMNPCAIKRYHKDLTGKSIKDCHPPKANEMIDKVVAWFKESKDNNIIYTYRNDVENKDVYMVALRDDDGTLIGYYEKHEYRNKETVGLYQPKKWCKNLNLEGCYMKNLKLFFSALTVAFGILGLIKALSTDITMPIMFVSLAITLFITSKEYKDKQQKTTAISFLLLGIFLLIVTAYNVASMIWGI